MSNATLIERQNTLLRYMTDVDFIFGRIPHKLLAENPALQGMDLGRLRLEAEMTYSKRIMKIGKVLPRTFHHLGKVKDAILEDFARQHRPDSYKRFDDAQKFVSYLAGLKAREYKFLEYVIDVARLEIALASRSRLDVSAPADEANAQISRPAVRFHPQALVVQCEYDVRSVFAANAKSSVPPKRFCSLVVSPPSYDRGPRVIELPGDVARLLETTEAWTTVVEHNAVLGPEADQLTQRLVTMGVLELLP